MFATYQRQDIVKDKTYEVKLWGLRNKDGSVPSVFIRPTWGNAQWEALTLLDAGGEAIIEGDDAQRAERLRRVRMRIAKALITEFANVFRDTGEPAIAELDALEFMALLPWFAVERILSEARDVTNFQGPSPFVDAEQLAKK